MVENAEEVVDNVLHYLQRTAWIRNTLGILLVVAVVGICGWQVYKLIPRSYELDLSGGNMLENRHFFAKAVQGVGVKYGLAINVAPVDTNTQALELVNNGKLQAALVQGGLDRVYPNVQQVATLAPEVVHLVVRPEIKSVADLRGTVINVGEKRGASEYVTGRILSYSGYQEGIDYSTTNYSPDQLVQLPPGRLPDAAFVISTVPSFLVEFLVKERGYKMIEIPFPGALAFRYGWIQSVTVQPYTYSVSPAVPEQGITSIGINMMLVANKNVPVEPLEKLLETIFDRGVANRLNLTLDDTAITQSTGYPLSPATFAYLDRNESIFSKQTVDTAKTWFEAILSTATSLLVVYKWFKGVEKEEEREAEEEVAKKEEKDGEGKIVVAGTAGVHGHAE